jgi:hypothetical protein
MPVKKNLYSNFWRPDDGVCLYFIKTLFGLIHSFPLKDVDLTKRALYMQCYYLQLGRHKESLD